MFGFSGNVQWNVFVRVRFFFKLVAMEMLILVHSSSSFLMLLEEINRYAKSCFVLLKENYGALALMTVHIFMSVGI